MSSRVLKPYALIPIKDLKNTGGTFFSYQVQTIKKFNSQIGKQKNALNIFSALFHFNRSLAPINNFMINNGIAASIQITILFPKKKVSIPFLEPKLGWECRAL